MTVRLLLGDCFDRLAELDDCSIDAVVTDPPYGLSFMGKHWDRFDIDRRVGARDVSKLGVRLTGGADSPNRKETTRTASAFANAAGAAGAYDFSLTGNRRFQEWCCELGVELLRVLKPGGHALVFGGTRTHHRMTCGLEDAGFEIRDELQWLFGSGFPKSLDVSKAIGARAGAEREIVETIPDRWAGKGNVLQRSTQDERAEAHITAPSTDDAKQWDGWGTALKPGHEPIVLARKPLSGTVAGTVLAHGTGALNIDGCRIEGAKGDGNWKGKGSVDPGFAGGWASVETDENPSGRWPANVVLDEAAAAMLDEQTGELVSGANPARRGVDGDRTVLGAFAGQEDADPQRGRDAGGASRFFYCAKVSRAERNAGLDAFEPTFAPTMGNGIGGEEHDPETATPKRNVHPTVKPLDLMRWLIRLVTPPGGTILDPFLGSGSTGCAAALEAVGFVGIEREPDYMAIAQARIAFWREHGDDGLRIVRDRDAADRVRQETADAGQLDMLSLLAEEGAA